MELDRYKGIQVGQTDMDIVNVACQEVGALNLESSLKVFPWIPIWPKHHRKETPYALDFSYKMMEQMF